MVPTEKATEADDRLRAALPLIRLVELLAMVISRPSRIHATPRATTKRVWKRDQRSRSMRAGTRLVTGPEPSVWVLGSMVVVTDPPRRPMGCGACHLPN